MRSAGTPEVVAVTGADIHVCHTPPLARTAEPDWYEAMARPFREVRQLCMKHQCPFLLPGDIFDDGWRQHRCPPELINFVIREMPKDTYAVPGNHDLPNHNYEELRRSAFWTLVEAGKITMLNPGEPRPVKTPKGHRLVLHGFPYGFEPKAYTLNATAEAEWMPIALVHHFIWKDGHTHPGAKEEDHVRTLRKKLNGFKVAVFGDNHSGFLSQLKGGDGVTIFNCGTFLRRRTDEADYTPRVGLIYSDGSVKTHFLNTENDVHETSPDIHKVFEKTADLSTFLEGLATLTDVAMDFADCVRQWAESNDVAEDVKKILYECLEGKKK